MDYFLIKPDGELTGTFSIEQIRDMLQTGFIASDVRYWHEGITEWRPIEHIEESVHFQPPVPATPESVTFRPLKLPAASRLVTPPGSKLEKSHSPPVPSIKAQEPSPADPLFLPSRNEPPPPAGPDTLRDAGPVALPLAEADRPQGKGLLGWVFYAINVTLVALAIDCVVPAVHYFSHLHQSKVTLTGDNIYVLEERSMIKSFADEMRNSPSAEALQHQIEQTTDPNSLTRLKIGLEKASAWHTDEIEQRYLQMGKAEFIDSGAYRLLDYLDDKGDPTTPRDGTPVWIAILYKNRIVYAYRAPGSSQATRSP